MLDQIFEFRFQAHSSQGKSKVRARHPDPSITKIGFVSDRWKGKQPVPGDRLLCRVVYESKREEKRLGYYLVMPLTIEEVRERRAMRARQRTVIAAVPQNTGAVWTVVDVSEGDQACALVTRIKRKGRADEKTDTWRLSRWTSVDVCFPLKVIRSLTAILGDGPRVEIPAPTTVVQTAPAEESTVSTASPAAVSPVESEIVGAAATETISPALEEQTSQPDKRDEEPEPEPEDAGRCRLEGARDVVVVSLHKGERAIEFEKLGTATGIYNVLVDGGVVGVYDWKGSVSRSQNSVETIRIVLSDGSDVQLCGKKLQVYTSEACTRKRLILDNMVELGLVDRASIGWSEARELVVGSVVGKEYPFQWLGNVLTNGQLSLPKERPDCRAAWGKLGIKALPAALWETFLVGLEGRFLDELLPYHEQVATRPKSEPAQPRLTARQRQLNAVVEGQMWQGSTECTHVSVGRNVIFHVERQGRPALHIVDNPGVGAIYVFTDRELAVQFASGLITRSEGIERGFRRIYHNDGWEQRLAALLSQAGCLPAAA